MTVTENIHQSWLSRIGNSFKGIVGGLLFVVLAVVLLFWNEGRAVHRRNTLNKAADIVVSISPEAVEPANDGKLVHLCGPAVTDETLADSMFDVSVHALKLRRKVEMYQWQEHTQQKEKRNTGGSTDTTITYSYQKGWSEQPISSADFRESGHDNPPMPYRSEEWTAGKITLGAFTLSDSLKSKIRGFVPYNPAENVHDSPSPLNERPSEPTPTSETSISVASEAENAPTVDTTSSEITISVTTPSATPEKADFNPPSERAKKSATPDGFYFGDSPENPAIGDIRVSYSVVMPTDLSLIACQTKDSFSPYIIKNNPVEELGMGIQSAEQMFSSAHSANNMAMWLLRALGVILCYCGFRALLGPLPVLADVLPIAGSIVSAGTGIVAFLLAGIVSLTTISFAWMFYRPLLGIPTLLAAVVLFFYLLKKLYSSRSRSAADSPK